MKKQSHYQTYDVMNEQEHWDDHTQSIVSSRLVKEKELPFFTRDEQEILKRVCGHLTGDQREEIIQYVIDHIGQSITTPANLEGQRKEGAAKADVLLRDGLAGLNTMAKEKYLFRFIELDPEKQRELLREISCMPSALSPIWGKSAPKDFFKKLLTFTVEAYCSYPTIWSEMGYGGPAYPRGYVRTQMGQLDPWEAQPEI